MKTHKDVTPDGAKSPGLTALEQELVNVLEQGSQCFGQHNLLSTATDEERRAALSRFFNWWNNNARHVVAKAKGEK